MASQRVVEKRRFGSAGPGFRFKCPNLLILLGGNKEKVAWKLSNIAIHDVSCSSYYVSNSSHLSSRSSNHWGSRLCFKSIPQSIIFTDWVENFVTHLQHSKAFLQQPLLGAFQIAPSLSFFMWVTWRNLQNSIGLTNPGFERSQPTVATVDSYRLDGNQKSGINSPVEGGNGSWTPIIYKVSYIQTVVVWDFFHQRYLPYYSKDPHEFRPFSPLFGTSKNPSREPTIHHSWDGAVKVTCLMTSYSTCWCCHVPCWWIKSYPPIKLT